jgi:hypothetical protein
VVWVSLVCLLATAPGCCLQHVRLACWGATERRPKTSLCDASVCMAHRQTEYAAAPTVVELVESVGVWSDQRTRAFFGLNSLSAGGELNQTPSCVDVSGSYGPSLTASQQLATKGCSSSQTVSCTMVPLCYLIMHAHASIGIQEQSGLALPGWYKACTNAHTGTFKAADTWQFMRLTTCKYQHQSPTQPPIRMPPTPAVPNEPKANTIEVFCQGNLTAPRWAYGISTVFRLPSSTNKFSKDIHPNVQTSHFCHQYTCTQLNAKSSLLLQFSAALQFTQGQTPHNMHDLITVRSLRLTTQQYYWGPSSCPTLSQLIAPASVRAGLLPGYIWLVSCGHPASTRQSQHTGYESPHQFLHRLSPLPALAPHT